MHIDPIYLPQIQHILGAISITFIGMIFAWILYRHRLYSRTVIGIAFVVLLYQIVHVMLHTEVTPFIGHLMFDYSFAMAVAYINSLCYKK